MIESIPGTPTAESQIQNSNLNPFSTPPQSIFGGRAPSHDSRASGFAYATLGGSRYFKSRRIVKGENPIVLPKKKPVERLTWIFPVGGLFLGICLTGLIIYMKIMSSASHKYCPVLNEDFASPNLDPKIWTMEVESGGFGYLSFSHKIQQLLMIS